MLGSCVSVTNGATRVSTRLARSRLHIEQQMHPAPEVGGVVELDQTGFTKGAVLALLHSGKGAVEEGLEKVLGLAEGLALGGAQALVLGD